MDDNENNSTNNNSLNRLLNQATVSEEFVKTKTNKTDFKRFNDFMDSFNKRYETVEKENDNEAIKKNLKKWDEKTPTRWRGASLKKIILSKNDPKALKAQKAAKRIATILKKDGKGSFFITGDAGSGKTFLSYAVIRYGIAQGWFGPSEIKQINENELLDYAGSGFNGREKFDQILRKKYKFFLIDGVGEKYDNYKNYEINMIERFIEYIHDESIPVIFTSTQNAVNFIQELSESKQAKMMDIVENGRIIYMDEKNKNVSSKNKKKNNIFDDRLKSFE